MKKKSTLTTPKLKKKLDRLFSKFIKLRDGGLEFFKCISCQKTKPLSQFNAGHYWSRRYMSTRYDEKNVNGQCIYCNMHLSGNIQGYREGLIKKYGEEILTHLEIKKNNISNMGRFEFEVLINEYNDKIKILKK
jgi:hypothetical protein